MLIFSKLNKAQVFPKVPRGPFINSKFSGLNKNIWGSVQNVRSLSKAFPKQAQEGTGKESKKKSRFDKSLVKPLLLILVFSSMLNNITEQRKKNAALEKRYNLKMEKYDELMKRAQTTGQTVFDLEKEFKLIDKMFERSDKFSFSPNIPNAKQASPLVEETEEDLSKLFSEIMKDADKTLEELQNEHLANSIALKGEDINADEIVTNKDYLHQENQLEQKIMKSYKADTSQHILVENSGDYANAPTTSKVKKFL